MASLAPTPQPRAAIYCRVSTPGQELDGTSLETQEAACRAFAADRGYLVDEAHVYREVFSGAALHERRRLAELRSAARASAIDRVVCHAVDRLSRNQAHLYILAEELEGAGARLEFVTEIFEDSAVGKFLRSAKAFAAEIEREKFLERSLRGKRARLSAGKLLPGKSPLYGYAWDASKTRYLINPITAPVARRVFAESLAGRSLRAIAGGLTADGIPTPRGAKLWDFVVVRNILCNPSYTGEAYAFRMKHVRVAGTHRTQTRHIPRPREEWVPLPEGTIPALVDPATFAAVQERLRRNQQQASRRLRNPEAYLLRGGYVRCGYCGYSMSLHHKTARGRPTVAYECVRRSRSAGLCTQHGMPTQVLDAAVWARVEAVLTRPEIIEQELQRLEGDDPTEAELAAVDRASADVSRRQANLSRSLSLFEDQEAAAPVVAEMEVLRAQERSLEAERQTLLARRASWATGQQRLADLQAWCRQVGTRLRDLTYQQRRMALDALGIEVRVWKADHDPRYSITANIPLDEPPQMGQDSLLYAASKNIHS